MRHSQLLEYVLIAVVVFFALEAAFTYVWPVIDSFVNLDKVISSALAGTK